MSDSVRINGVQFSYSSASLKVNGETYTGWTAIAYGDALEVVKGYGAGRHHAPRGRSAGKYVPEPVRLTVWKSTGRELRAQIAQLSPTGTAIGRAEFPMVLTYAEDGEGPHTVEFDRCRYVKTSATTEESADPLKEEIEIDVMSIRRDGLTLYDESPV